MRYIAAFALLVLAGNENPEPSDIEKVLRAAGVTIDVAELEELLYAFEGKRFHELVNSGPRALLSKSAPKKKAPILGCQELLPEQVWLTKEQIRQPAFLF